jgi:hypothetical protein
MRKTEMVLTLGLLGSAAMSLWLWSELRAERSRNAELIALASSVPRTDLVPGAAATQELLPPTPSPASAKTDIETAATPMVHVQQSADEDPVAYQRRMMKQPGYREAWRQQQRLNYAPRHENLIRLLGLTPEQADAVIDIDLYRQIAWFEKTPEGPEAQEADEKDHQAKLGALLGEEKRAQLQVYMESRGSRMQVDRFRSQLSGADALRDDQVEPLIAALHVESAQMRKEMDEYGESLSSNSGEDTSSKYNDYFTEKMKASHARMHAAASPILSNTQLAKLDALLKHELERQEAQVRMQRAQSGNSN